MLYVAVLLVIISSHLSHSDVRRMFLVCVYLSSCTLDSSIARPNIDEIFSKKDRSFCDSGAMSSMNKIS